MSKEYRSIVFHIFEAHKSNAQDAEIRDLFRKMEQLAEDGDKGAMSFIEKARLATSSDNIKPNTVWRNGGIYDLQKVTVDDDLR